MPVTESRIELMNDFMAQRIDHALRKNSRCTTKYCKGKAVYFFQMDDGKFEQLTNDVLGSIKEYLQGDWFTKKSIEPVRKPKGD